MIEERSKLLSSISKKENISINLLKRNISGGLAVVLANKNRKNIKPIAVGKDLTVKVNANIGASPDDVCLKKELKKLNVAMEAGGGCGDGFDYSPLFF